MKTYRLRIARLDGLVVRYLPFIGPLHLVPAGWSIVCRRVA